MTARNLVLVRHGESRTNATSTFQAGDQYATDPLTERGERAAEELAERFAGLSVDVVLSSGYLRARMTAARIAATSGAPHVVPAVGPEGVVDRSADDVGAGGRRSLLREIDVPTALEGLRFDDPRARAIQRAALAVSEQPGAHHSDEENLHDLWQRAEAIRLYLEGREESLTVVVAHGGILKVLLAHLMFTAVDGLDSAGELAAYRGFTRLGWWDNTGAVSLRFTPGTGWLWLMTDIDHLHPAYFGFMPAEGTKAPDEGAEYLGRRRG